MAFVIPSAGSRSEPKSRDRKRRACTWHESRMDLNTSYTTRLALALSVWGVCFAGTDAPNVYHAVASPNAVMLGNDVNAVWYIVRDVTPKNLVGREQRVVAITGPCPLSNPDAGARITIKLDGHKPFRVHIVLASGPARVGKSDVQMAVAPAPADMARRTIDCK
jgi:hypothetical protein